MGTENDTINRIPAEAHALLDVRFPAPHTFASMLAAIRGSLGGAVDSEVLVAAEPTHLAPNPLYQEVTTEVTDRPVRLVRDSGGSDARFLTRHGVGVLMSRPLVGNLNAPDEWIDIESMLVFHRICDVYLRRRFELPPEPDGA